MPDNQLELGYRFHELSYPGASGYSRVDVNIYSEPTHEHFDPEALTIPAVNDDGVFEKLSITHPWPYFKNIRICAGRIRLRDRFQKSVLMYSFGGEVSVEVMEEKTTCRITSRAPILHIDVYESIQRLLAEEIEIMLAEFAAVHLPGLDDYYQWLIRLKPWEFYVRSLVDVHNKYADFPELPSVEEFNAFLDEQLRIIHEQRIWPVKLLRLEQLVP